MKSLMKVLLVVAVSLFVISLIPADEANKSSNPHPANSPAQTANDDAGYRYACQELIAKRLSAPSSAVFPPKDEWTITPLGSNKYRLQSWVDAQNAFGVPLRHHFDAVVAFDGRDYWWLESFSIE
jgi:hypothetical protein